MNTYLLTQDIDFLKQINTFDFRKKEGKKLLQLSNIKTKKELLLEVDKILQENKIVIKHKTNNKGKINDKTTGKNKTKNSTEYVTNDIFKISNEQKNKLTNASNINAIIKIQYFVRKYMSCFINNKYGCALKNRKISTNDTDFYTFDDIDDIPVKYFISYKEDNFMYSFDIRSLECLFERFNYVNPYNRKPFAEGFITLVNNRVSKINELKKKQEEKEKRKHKKSKENPEIITKLRTTDLFLKMDTLDQYTDVKWFNDLAINELKKYYGLLEDIWNYRLQLSPEQKKKIVKNPNIFNISVREVYDKRSINEIRNIILDQIEMLITEGDTREDKITGCMYVLTAFVKVSRSARENLPWLL